MGLTRCIAPILGAALILAGAARSESAHAAAQAQYFPDGPGKDIFLSVCSLCHEPSAVATKQWSEKQWDLKVTEMLQEEPDVTAEERAAIVKYLAANFKPLTRVSINRVPAAIIASALGISATEAEAIVRDRQEKGAFKSHEDLKRVPGLKAETLEALRGRLEFD